MKFSWSIISIISRFTAVGIGLVQSVLIVKLLSIGEYGLIGLVGSIGAVVGVYQNLGISSGSTREIAAAKDKFEAFKVFIGSLLVRYLISLPLVIGLFVLAPKIGGEYYNQPEIIWPIRIFALTLFIQALQSVLNSVIQGLREFKFLFIFQVLIAVVSISTYIPLIYYFGFIGYFYALLTFNLISTLILFGYSYKLFNGHIEFPTRSELWAIFKAVFSIGVYVYLIKILIVQWEKLGPLFLGNTVTEEALGIFAFALLVASKVVVISDAITDVTLPSMTKAFEESRDKFREIFIEGNSKAYFLILFASVMLVLLKRELFLIVDFIFGFVGTDPITDRYAESFVIMDPLILGFWAYSHINLLKSGLSVPTKKMWSALLSTAVMFVFTFVAYYLIDLEPLLRFSLSMGLGALVAYLIYLFLIRKVLGFYPISKSDVLFTLVSVLIISTYFMGINVLILAAIYSIITYYWYAKNFK